jgi:hypothetical protein
MERCPYCRIKGEPRPMAPKGRLRLHLRRMRSQGAAGPAFCLFLPPLPRRQEKSGKVSA